MIVLYQTEVFRFLHENYTEETAAFSVAEIADEIGAPLAAVVDALSWLRERHLVENVTAPDGVVYWQSSVAEAVGALEELVRRGDVVVETDENGVIRYRSAPVS